MKGRPIAANAAGKTGAMLVNPVRMRATRRRHGRDARPVRSQSVHRPQPRRRNPSHPRHARGTKHLSALLDHGRLTLPQRSRLSKKSRPRGHSRPKPTPFRHAKRRNLLRPHLHARDRSRTRNSPRHKKLPPKRNPRRNKRLLKRNELPRVLPTTVPALGVVVRGGREKGARLRLHFPRSKTSKSSKRSARSVPKRAANASSSRNRTTA